MERKWTEEQRAAIEDRGNTLLVSASAGSGKTSVLTARLISRLTDEENPADVSRILVVTFTRTSAADLREKIAAVLTSAVAADPGNKYLRSQLLRLGGAQISTIHSFCTSVIRDNFDALGIGVGQRIADEAEITLITRDIFNSVINEFYERGEAYGLDDFSLFCENFTRGRDEKIADIFSSLYKKLRNHPLGIDFLAKTAEEYSEYAEKDYFYTPTGSALREYFTDKLGYFNKLCDFLEKCAETDGDLADKYLPTFSDDRELYTSLRAATEGGYEKTRAALGSAVFSRIGTIKQKTESAEYFKAGRDKARKYINETEHNHFEYSQSEISLFYQRTADELKKLHTFLTCCEKKLGEEKRRRGILDYSDLERLTVALLRGENGEGSAVAASLRDKYDEIYIDEYQDVNPLQDEIFSRISRPDNRFMVGDVKQSIYGFRGADPSFFSSYKERFSEENGGGKALYLSSNFRSGKNVVDFANAVCGKLFSAKSGVVGYTEKDNLVFARPGDDPSSPTEIDIVGRENSAAFCAERIKRLIDEKQYRPGQIAILLRRHKNAQRYVEELTALGIPCRAAKKKGLLERPEVLLLLCLLNTIDNPGRDIYLAGTLKSALCGFSLEELERIRAAKKDGNLFSAFCAYAEESGDGRAMLFLSELEGFRGVSRSSAVDSLIWNIFLNTPILSLCDDDGRDNLLCFYETARSFEAGSFRGLYNFLIYVDDAMKSGGLEEFSPSDSDDTVKIMTVHASKGLEFPVCFICENEIAAAPNIASAETVIIDFSSGVSMILGDKSGFGKAVTPQFSAMKQKAKCDSGLEDMRTIYVALTRASEKLIIVAENDEPETKVTEAELNAECFCYSMLTDGAKSVIDWILAALFASGYKGYELNYPDLAAADGEEEEQAEPTAKTEADPILCEKIKERLSFRYPFERVLSLPSKLTASVIYPGILDEEDEEYKKPPVSRRPRFLSDTAGHTGAERGTATHVFMQFCSFTEAGNDPRAEAIRLVSEGFITENMVELIDFGAVRAFFASPLYAEMRKSRSLRREKRFGIEIPAAVLTLDSEARNELEGENVFVQGVIDCFFEDENGEIVLVDYKTDRFSREELQSPDEVRRTLVARHKTQLGYYRFACEKLTCRPVGRVLIYSFCLGETVEIPYSPL